MTSAYDILRCRISDLFKRKETQKLTYQQIQEQRAKHSTAFMSEINNKIDYASKNKSELTCVMVDFRDEYALPEFFSLLVGAYHGNNGFYPSNEIRRTGKGQIGALIHASAEDVEATLEAVVRQFIELLPINSDIKFRAGVAEYENGDDRESLMKRAQYFVDIDLKKSDKPHPQENYQELTKKYGPEATMKRLDISDKEVAAVA